MTGEKEGQGMVRSKIVFRRHWATPPLIVLFNGSLLSRSKSDNHRHDLGGILISLGFGNRTPLSPSVDKTGNCDANPQGGSDAHYGLCDFGDRDGLNRAGGGPDIRSGLSGLPSRVYPGGQLLRMPLHVAALRPGVHREHAALGGISFSIALQGRAPLSGAFSWKTGSLRLNRILKRNAFRIVFLEPNLGRDLRRKDLHVIAVADMLASVDIYPDLHCLLTGDILSIPNRVRH